MLMTALFVVVVLAAMVMAMLNLSLSQTASYGMRLQSTRATLAAQSGLEWGLYQGKNGRCMESSHFVLKESDLTGFDVEVTCSLSRFVEGADVIELLQIESIAQWGRDPWSGEQSRLDSVFGAEENSGSNSDYVYRKLSQIIEL